MSAATRHDDRASGRWIPLTLLGCLALLVAVQGVFLTLAFRSDPGVVAPNAYERGLAHNAVLREAAAGAALGWRVAVDHRPGADRQGMLAITVTDREGQPVTGLRIAALALRPTRGGLDQPVTVREQGAGHYAADYALPASGLWELGLLLARDGREMQHASRFSAP